MSLLPDALPLIGVWQRSGAVCLSAVLWLVTQVGLYGELLMAYPCSRGIRCRAHMAAG